MAVASYLFETMRSCLNTDDWTKSVAFGWSTQERTSTKTLSGAFLSWSLWWCPARVLVPLTVTLLFITVNFMTSVYSHL